MAHIGYGYGSEWHLLHELGRRRAALTAAVERATGLSGVQWLDHVERVDPENGWLTLRETSGVEFLSATDPARIEWESTWPQSGNVHNWDSVAHAAGAGQGSWILVEAKANTSEVASSWTAKSPDSRSRINAVLDRTKQDLGVAPSADWASGFYQYCNRVALLNYLTARGVDAHLVFIYFIGDRMDLGGVGRECPINEAGWDDVLAEQARHVGIPADAPIKARIHQLFVQVHRANVAAKILRPEYCRAPLARGTGPS